MARGIGALGALTLVGCDGAADRESAAVARAALLPAQPPQTRACDEGLDIRDFGATETADVRAAFQSATDAAARGEGGGTVYVPPGVWTFRSADERGRLVTTPVNARVAYRGVAGASVLTVADGMMDWDGFRSDGPGKLELEDLIFDGNAAGNLIPRGKGLLQSWIYLEWCEHLAMRRIHFRNHAGARCVTVGNGTVRARTAGSVELRQVTAHNVGSSVPGNAHLHDHSTFWINADACSIVDCAVDSDRPGAYDTFIENHSSNSVVMGNRIRNVRIGIIVAALFNEQVNSLYVTNVMDAVESGYRFYCQNGQRLAVAVHGGSVRQRGATYAVFDAGHCADTAERIAFHDVAAENAQPSADGDDGHGYVIGRVRSFEVYGGILRGLRGRALSLSTYLPAGDGIAAVTVRGLTVEDCARGRVAAGEAIGMHERDSARLRDLTVEDCTFRNTVASGPMRRAIAGSIDVIDRISIRRNAFVNIDPGCAWSADAHVGRIELDVEDTVSRTGSDPVARAVRASLGSRWLDAASGHSYEKRSGAAPTDARGWVKTAVVSDERLPRDGTWRTGDRLINLPGGGAARTVHGPPGARYVIDYWEARRDARLSSSDDPQTVFAEHRLYTGS